jgi:hypothetical protein
MLTDHQRGRLFERSNCGFDSTWQYIGTLRCRLSLPFVDLLEATRIHQRLGGYQVAKKAVKRRSWSTVDVKTLRALARKKTRAGSIAKTLKRSEATCQKAFSLGLSLDSR